MAAETTQAQCQAITEDGERCERPAGDDGFCFQHDESDETVDEHDDEAVDAGDTESEGTDDGSSGESTEPLRADGQQELTGVREVRESVQSLAPDVIGRELDAVIEVERRDDGWQAVVEIVERPAVPDTQDILGRYEIDLTDGAVTGYRRVDRYRRGDTEADEPR